ncbi:MAG: histidine phosphatase family protein [Hyphomicrobiales bacterium]
MSTHPLYFLRHGETQWNLERKLQGSQDIPLNATGHDQAKAMAAGLFATVPDAVEHGFSFHVSPLTRTRETMSYVQEHYGLHDDALIIDERLKELNFGTCEGKTWTEVDKIGPNRETHPAEYHDWLKPGGESYLSATPRVRDWYDSLSGPTIVVAHGGISRILRGFVLGLTKVEIVNLKVSQTKFYRLTGNAIDWFDAL